MGINFHKFRLTNMRTLGIVIALLGFYLTSTAYACDSPHVHSHELQVTASCDSVDSDNAPYSSDSDSHHHSTECSCFTPPPHAVHISVTWDNQQQLPASILLPYDLTPHKASFFEQTKEISQPSKNHAIPPSVRTPIFCSFLI